MNFSAAQRSLSAERSQVLITASLFQLGWLLCVIGGTVVALPTTALVLAVHFHLADQPRQELQFAGFAVLIGLVCDWLLLQAGVLQFGEAWLQPLWLLCLWPLFATNFSRVLRLFHDRLLLCALLGAAAAPISYFGGSRLAGIELLEPLWLALLLIACTWAVVFPVMMIIHQKLMRRRFP